MSEVGCVIFLVAIPSEYRICWFYVEHEVRLPVFEASLQLLLQFLSVRYLVALYFTVEARSSKISFF